MQQLLTAKSFANRNPVSKHSDHQFINTLSIFPMKEKISFYNPIKNSDPKVWETVVTDNHRYVVCVAKRFQNNGLSLHELIIKGNLGLIKAAQHFDQTSGFTFLSYAIWCIRQAIIQPFMEDIRNKPIPLNEIGIISNRNSLFSKLKRYCEREPTTQEIEGMMEFQTKIMNDALQVTSNQMSNKSVILK